MNSAAAIADSARSARLARRKYNQILPPSITLTTAVEALAGAMLVGLLIGAQRETAGGEHHPGLRDFLIVSVVAGVCGVLAKPWLDAAGLASVAAIFAVYHYEDRAQRSGITTELAALATFVLALLAASPEFRFGLPLAVGITIVVAAFLEARARLHTLLRETITEQEFNATLSFVLIVLVIYPLLPPGSFGPYAFFAPRQVWMFVILISSISYVGYFLEKFLGEEKGLIYASILGGLASTTAATLHFSAESKERPEQTLGLWRAFVIANTVQFPRTALIAALVSPDLLRALAWPLAAMTVAGVILSEVLHRWPHVLLKTVGFKPGNPFRLLPALKFGAFFTAVVFITKFATNWLGSGAFLGTSLLGGLVDVATVIAPAVDLMGSQRITLDVAALAVLLALASNAALKIMCAAATGTRAFTLRVTATFALWAAIGAIAWWIVRGAGSQPAAELHSTLFLF
jgi:uncharacterized membrane protein (DUF4010 family)